MNKYESAVAAANMKYAFRMNDACRNLTGAALCDAVRDARQEWQDAIEYAELVQDAEQWEVIDD